jgi:hypothetical protein
MSRNQFALVSAIAVAFLLINLATSSRFPLVWNDEVYYAEPAVNANLGLGFTSYANVAQPHGRFWAGNTPLYSMLLTGWLKAVGIGVVQVRSFGYVIVILAAVALWLATIRLRLITSTGMRTAFILTLLLAYGPGLCYRGARYDTLSILLVSLVMLAASVGSTPFRLTLILALGAACTMTQVSAVIFVAQIGMLLLLFYGRAYFREVVALGIGTVLGGALLYALFQFHGVWPDFLAALRFQRGEIGQSQHGIPKDPSFPAILTAAAILALDQFRRGDFRWRSPLIFGLIAGVFVPFGQLALVRWYPTYYTWTAILPLACGIFSEFSRARSAIHPFSRTAAMGALCASALLGVPMQLASAVWFWQERDYDRVVSLVQRHVGKQDCAFCDPEAYYAAKATAGTVFLTTYDWSDRFFTSAEKQRISVMVIAPSNFEGASKLLGGTWARMGEPVRPPERGMLFFRKGFGEKFSANYDLQVYRRNRASATDLSEAKAAGD